MTVGLFESFRNTPVIRQSEASECGLVCLAMVASHHQLHTDLPTLRMTFSVSMKGTTLKTLMDMAEHIGLNCRALRGDLDNLNQLALPSILHWDLNHFVVLTRIRRRVSGVVFEVNDPARGQLRLTTNELSRSFTGVAIEISKAESFVRRKEPPPFRLTHLWSRTSGLTAALSSIFIVSAVLQLVTLAMPFYLQIAVDTAIPSSDRNLLTMLAVGFGGLAVINFVAAWIRSYLLVSIGGSLSYQLVVNLYRHLLRLPLSWFEKRHVGDIISRFGSTQPVSDLLSQGLIAAFIDGWMAVLTVILMLIYSPILAALALAACSVFAIIKILSFKSLRLTNISTITAQAQESSSFIETVRGISAIKAFGQELNRQRLWQRRKVNAINAQIKLGRLNAAFDATGQFVLAIEKVLFVLLAVKLAIDAHFTVGMIFAFQAYKQQFLEASTRLIDAGIRYRLLDVHLSRISDIALSSEEFNSAARSENGAEILGDIELKDVSFRYGIGESDVLKRISVKIEAGSFVALVGPSGGGKTTLLKIMMGLLEPNSGQVLVDGVPLASFGLLAWRRRIGSVAQDDLLYAGTLAENIAFFDPAIDMRRVVAAAQQAAVHQEIEAMPMRFDSLVGDMGSVLSGGQRQRVLLARAFYADPAALFIDEGTAHLDLACEQQIMGAIANLPITRVVSGHRPGSIARASRIFVVAGGSIQELDALAARQFAS